MARRDLTGAVDFAHLERYAGGDQALVDEVLELFREQVAVWLRLLAPDAPAGAWKDAAHSLKGSALGVGAFDLAKACEGAEAARDSNIGGRQVALERVRDTLDLALADVAAYAHERALQSLRSP
ncbi:MAG TPA: Hpt domain-containing protein [Caulobacteraceae bacterium]